MIFHHFNTHYLTLSLKWPVEVDISYRTLDFTDEEIEAGDFIHASVFIK